MNVIRMLFEVTFVSYLMFPIPTAIFATSALLDGWHECALFFMHLENPALINPQRNQ